MQGGNQGRQTQKHAELVTSKRALDHGCWMLMVQETALDSHNDNAEEDFRLTKWIQHFAPKRSVEAGNDPTLGVAVHYDWGCFRHVRSY